MDFPTWEPVYERVLSDFGYPRTGDDRARSAMAALVDPADEMPDFGGDRVAVAGAAPSLEAETAAAEAADTVVAASTAAPRLVDAGVSVDVLVTDLDGAPKRARAMAKEGVTPFVHAHGDNVPLVRRHVPQFPAGTVVPTTQTAPAGPVRNCGGFTDGDRAAFLADHFGATELVFLGWDFDDPSVGSDKRHKLRWAERLLYWLERRRNAEFAVLDGRREGLTSPA